MTRYIVVVIYYLIFVYDICTAQVYKAFSNVSIHESMDSNAYWFEYSKKYFDNVLETGLFQDYPNIINNANKGLSYIQDKADFEKYATYYFHKGYAYKVQLHQDSALKYLKQSLYCASKVNNIALEVRSITQINYLLRFLGRNTETEPYIKALTQLSYKVNNEKDREAIATSLSEAYLYNGNYSKAIQLILPLIPNKEKRYVEDPSYANRINLGNAYSNAGNMYMQLGQFNKASHYLRLTLSLMDGYIGAIVRTRNSLLELHLTMGNLDSAHYEYIQIYKANSDTTKFLEFAELSNANRSFAEYYLANSNIPLANKYAQRANYFSEKSERLETILRTKKLLAKISFQQDDYKKVIQYLQPILSSSSAFNRDFYNENLILLANSYEKLHDYKQSLHYFKLYNESSSQSYKEKSDEKILDVEIRYQTQKKQHEIDNLYLQQKLTKDQIDSKNKLQFFLLVVLILVICITGLIYKNYRNKKSVNKLLEKKYSELEKLSEQLKVANHTKAKLFSIIAHDLRSPVSKLFSYMKMQESAAEIKDFKKYQQQLVNSSSSLLETMEDLLVWSKSQLERFEVYNEDIDLSELFNSLFSLLELQSVMKNVKLEVASLELDHITSDYNILHTILRNILQNALNYTSNDSTVYIRCDMHPHKCIIITNPIQSTSSHVLQSVNKMQIDSHPHGMGIMLVKDLVELLGLQIDFSTVDNHMQVKLSFS